MTDISAASGATSNVYGVNTEYSRSGGGSANQIQYLIHAGTPIADTDAYPASGCSVTTGFAQCVSYAQYQAELSTVLTNDSLPADVGHIYVLFLPQGVDTSDNDGGLASAGWCGIHYAVASTSPAGVIVSADMPYPISGCMTGQSPNDDIPADSKISTLSHELNEAITDPSPPASQGWFDSAGNEIGDECSYNFGAPIASTDTSTPESTQSTEYNQVINGHFYYTQRSFSNATFARLGLGFGCVQTQAQTQTTPPAPNNDQLSANPTDVAANGTATSAIAATVTDAQGNAIANDNVTFAVQAPTDGSGSCGTVSPESEMTDASGQVSVTYTASSDTATCDVIATEAEGGTTADTMVYQGAASAAAPTITASFPTSLTVGATPVMFSVTSSNPSMADLSSTRVDLSLTGDSNSTSAVSAAHVNLSYANDSTNGQFVTVPLTGTTAANDQISGFLLPAQGSTLGAQDSSVTTFELSLASGSPASSTTGAPLHIEADLDEIDPADGATSNLDYVGPADATVIAAPATTTTSSTTSTVTATQTATAVTSTATATATTHTVIAPARASSTCRVPKLVGHTLAHARLRLRLANCPVVVLIEPPGKLARGQKLVVSLASPKAGTRTRPNAPVTLTLRRTRVS